MICQAPSSSKLCIVLSRLSFPIEHFIPNKKLNFLINNNPFPLFHLLQYIHGCVRVCLHAMYYFLAKREQVIISKTLSSVSIATQTDSSYSYACLLKTPCISSLFNMVKTVRLTFNKYLRSGKTCERALRLMPKMELLPIQLFFMFELGFFSIFCIILDLFFNNY